MRRLIELYPDVEANCFDVKFPQGKSEKNVKRGGRREIGARIARSLAVGGPGAVRLVLRAQLGKEKGEGEGQ